MLCAGSPTGASEMAKLKEKLRMDQQKIEHLEERMKYLEEANRELKNDKDFLLSQIKRPPQSPASTGMSGRVKIQLMFFMLYEICRDGLMCRRQNSWVFKS